MDEPTFQSKAVKANIYSVRVLQDFAKKGFLPQWLRDLKADPRNVVSFHAEYLYIRYVLPNQTRHVVAAKNNMFLARLENGCLRVLTETEFVTRWEQEMPSV